MHNEFDIITLPHPWRKTEGLLGLKNITWRRQSTIMYTHVELESVGRGIKTGNWEKAYMYV